MQYIALWGGVTSDHDNAIGGFKPITERVLRRAMVRVEGFHSNVCVFVHDARRDLVHVDLVAGAI